MSRLTDTNLEEIIYCGDCICTSYEIAEMRQRLWEYENLGSVEEIVQKMNELEVYKRALGLTVNHICEVSEEDYNESHCPLRKFEKDYEDYRLECKCNCFQRLDDYYLDQARKELEDENRT